MLPVNDTLSPAVVTVARNSSTQRGAATCFSRYWKKLRQKFNFVIWGYVVMPEHFHVLISEPEQRNVALLMQVLKQRVSRRCRRKKRSAGQMTLWTSSPPLRFWQRRYYDFNVFSERKHVEKLRYMHRNPVKRGLVTSPELWRWSSFRSYWFAEEGLVKIGA